MAKFSGSISQKLKNRISRFLEKMKAKVRSALKENSMKISK